MPRCPHEGQGGHDGIPSAADIEHVTALPWLMQQTIFAEQGHALIALGDQQMRESISQSQLKSLPDKFSTTAERTGHGLELGQVRLDE